MSVAALPLAGFRIDRGNRRHFAVRNTQRFRAHIIDCRSTEPHGRPHQCNGESRIVDAAKLYASLHGRWPELAETRQLLEPYGEWQGLASVFLLTGFKRGLVPGASLDHARLVRARHRAAA